MLPCSNWTSRSKECEVPLRDPFEVVAVALITAALTGMVYILYLDNIQ
jgi:hypothetical protein